MPVLRLFELPFVVTKNRPLLRRNKLRLFEFDFPKAASFQSFISGSVQDAEGTGLSNRTVTAFVGTSVTNQAGQTYTDSDGNFSIAVTGGASGVGHTVIAKREGEENTQVFSGVTIG